MAPEWWWFSTFDGGGFELVNGKEFIFQNLKSLPGARTASALTTVELEDREMNPV